MTADRRAALVEAVAQAISNAWDSEQRIFEAAEAAIDLIRAETLEEAAKVADAFPAFTHGNLAIAPERVAGQVAGEIAAAIRALTAG